MKSSFYCCIKYLFNVGDDIVRFEADFVVILFLIVVNGDCSQTSRSGPRQGVGRSVQGAGSGGWFLNF